MIGSALATLLMTIVAMLPGLLLARDRARLPGQAAAGACASLVMVMLVTALLGAGWHALTGTGWPAWTMGLVAVFAVLLMFAAERRGATERPRPIKRAAGTGCEWQGWLLAAVMVGFGLFTQALSVRQDTTGALYVHAWYNADWFKHLGHVAALADFGVPARDIFDGGAPLHYYWLSYLLPGAGAAVGGGAWTALTVANAIFVGLLSFVLYGTLRLATQSPAIALIAGLSSFFAVATTRMAIAVLTGDLSATMQGTASPDGPELLAFAQYLPQHTLSLATLLAWFLLDRPAAEPAGDSGRRLRLLGLAGIAPVLAMSTLLGALVLATYGLQQLWRRRAGAVVEVGAMALISVGVVFALGVLALDPQHASLKAPMLTEPTVARPLMAGMADDLARVIARLGLPLLLAAIWLWRSRHELSNEQTDNRRFAIVALAIGILGAPLGEAVLAQRVAFEVLLRAPSIAVFGLALLLTAWFDRAWSDRRTRPIAAALLALVWLIALPSAVLRTIWHSHIGDDFTTAIPADDMAMLHVLGQRAATDAVVLQYPERPYLATPPGRDTWVPLIAQRAIVSSYRATDYAGAQGDLAAIDAFFAGKRVAIPAASDWVYLSRSVHPATFDALSQRMRGERGWREIACNAGACLFERTRDGVR